VAAKAKASVTARVTVYPRPEILDPQGKAIHAALERLGFHGVRDVRAGKSFRVVVEGKDKAAAEKAVSEMAAKLLSNPVVEDFAVELEEAAK
jgi:phosphoribosylformylglycinamidine synthase